jgi:HEPN domain-containing protein
MAKKNNKIKSDAEKFIDEAISEIKPLDKREVTSMVPDAAVDGWVDFKPERHPLERDAEE